MHEFRVIIPATEESLSTELRSQPLTDRVLQLTVALEPDELSIRRGIRRGGAATEEVLELHVDSIHTERPTAVMGRVTINGVFRAARIDAVGDGDDSTNTLRLSVVE